MQRITARMIHRPWHQAEGWKEARKTHSLPQSRWWDHVPEIILLLNLSQCRNVVHGKLLLWNDSDLHSCKVPSSLIAGPLGSQELWAHLPSPVTFHILAVLSPCHAEAEGSWSGSGAGCVLAQVFMTQLGLTGREWVWLIVRHLASWGHPQMFSQPLHHIMELMQSLHCLSCVEVNCPGESKNPNQTSLSVQLYSTPVNLNLGYSHLQ